MSLHRPWTRHVHLCCHKFGQKNHTTTCRVRRYVGIPVIRSKKHGYEGRGLGFNQTSWKHQCLCTRIWGRHLAPRRCFFHVLWINKAKANKIYIIVLALALAFFYSAVIKSSSSSVLNPPLILHSEFIRLLFLQAHRETDRFFATSGVQITQPNRGLFHFRRAAFLTNLKAKVGSTLTKAATLRITLNIDGAPITSRTHTHPSHSQTSRLLTSSLSLGVPVPRTTQCMSDM